MIAPLPPDPADVTDTRERVARWLYDTFGLESAAWPAVGSGSRKYFTDRADELLSVVADTTAGDPT